MNRDDPSPPHAPSRLVAVAAGTLGELGAADMVATAASAGWRGVGLAFDSGNWSNRVAKEVKRRLDDTGVLALDMEAVFVSAGGDEGERIVDAAADVGASNVLVVALGIETGAFVERFAELCDRAAAADVRCVVEFTPILSIPDLDTALAVVETVGRPNAGILVDNLHLARSGGSPEDLAGIDPALMPYVQLCDAPAEAPDDLFGDALQGRCLPGDGGLPVTEYLQIVPASTPLSAEVLSASLRVSHPDPLDRARAVLTATRAALERAAR